MSKSVKRTPPSAFSAPPQNRESVLFSRLPRLIEGFLLHGDVSGHSSRTLENRRQRLAGLTWFAQNRSLEELGVHELRAFFQYMRHGHEDAAGLWGLPHHKKALSSGTIKSYHSSLRTFFNWLVAEGDLDTSPMERITPPVDRPDQVQPFTTTQLKAMQQAASRASRREAAVFCVFLDTGIRASELCGLTVADANLTDGQLLIRSGKGGKARSVPISSDTKRALYQWLKERGEVELGDPLFPSTRGVRAGEHMTKEGMLKMVRRWGTAAGFSRTRLSPHTFRHTFAVTFLRLGGDVFTLKAILGHESLTMVNRYVALAQADVTRKHALFSPLSSIRKR